MGIMIWPEFLPGQPSHDASAASIASDLGESAAGVRASPDHPLPVHGATASTGSDDDEPPRRPAGRLGGPRSALQTLFSRAIALRAGEREGTRLSPVLDGTVRCEGEGPILES